MRSSLLRAVAALFTLPVAAYGQSTADTNPGVIVGSFYVFNHTDPVTDEIKSAAILKSGDVVFGVGCLMDRKTVRAYVQSRNDVVPTSLMRTGMTFRVNSNTPIRQDWYYEGNIAYTYDDRNLEALISEMKYASKLVVRIPAREGGYSDAIFEVSDTIAAMRKMAPWCHDQKFMNFIEKL
jgi:hypothetical protein